MNFVEIAGFLAADPETKQLPSGQKVTSFRMGCEAKQGKEKATVWWKVTVWGDKFDKMMPYIKKGSPLIVCGDMSPPRVYQDKGGDSKVSMELTAEIIRFSPFGKAEASEPGLPF